ncbi:MAG: NADH-quinone oxidoreductase subunit J [Chloroflexi bacterium]|nr:NADH-quinone oxidoreductase subunit J [Chloroflexota bacterium]
MDISVIISKLAFYPIAAVILIAAILVVSLRNVFYAALSLILCFLGVASLYLLLHAEFLAGAQVLIYIGAISVLIIFAIMFTKDISHQYSSGTLLYRVSVGFVLFLLFLVMTAAYLLNAWTHAAAGGTGVSITDIGKMMLSTYLLPFEALSVLLLAALIGALFLARKEER